MIYSLQLLLWVKVFRSVVSRGSFCKAIAQLSQTQEPDGAAVLTCGTSLVPQAAREKAICHPLCLQWGYKHPWHVRRNKEPKFDQVWWQL